LELSETIEVKVVDKDDNFSTVDSYFFAYFQDLPGALDQIRDAVRSYRSVTDEPIHTKLIDTTVARSALPSTIASFEHAGVDQTPRSSSIFRFPSLWRPFYEAVPSRPVAADPGDTTEDFTHISRRKSTFIPFTTSPDATSVNLPSDIRDVTMPQETSQSSTATPANIDHTYPPTTPPVDNSTGYLAWGRPSWLKIPSRRPVSLPLPGVGAEHHSTSGSGITDVLTSALSSAGNKLAPDLGFSVLDVPASQLDQDVQDKFRAAFAFDDKEHLMGCE
jgi:sterol 3beta-glucosyltransferase